MSLFPIPAIIRERVALSTMSGIWSFLTDYAEYPWRGISRETSAMIKCHCIPSADSRDVARVDRGPEAQDRTRFYRLHSRSQRLVRVLALRRDEAFVPQPHLGCRR